MITDLSTPNNINLNIYVSTYDLKGHSQKSIIKRKPYVYKKCILRS